MTEEANPKIIMIPVIDGVSGELVYLEMEEQSFLEWESALEEERKEKEAKREERSRLEREAWRYVRDDD